MVCLDDENASACTLAFQRW